MAYWLFQGNPKYYRVLDALRDFEQMPWLVTRYAKEMAVGDGVLIWVSGKEAGIYAIAELLEAPKMWGKNVPDRGYWIDENRLGSKPQAKIRLTRKLFDKPLLRDNLKQDPLLQNLLVIRAPNSTNYKIAPGEWQRVHELKG